MISLMPATETGTCETHAGLLEDFEVARDEWNARRTEISNSGLRGKRIDDELRCLQARFAKSYALVLNHLRDCRSCEPSRGADHGAGVMRAMAATCLNSASRSFLTRVALASKITSSFGS